MAKILIVSSERDLSTDYVVAALVDEKLLIFA